MFFIAVALMSSIGEIWWEEKKTQTNKQTRQANYSICVSYFLLHANRVQKEIGDVCT